MVCSQSTPPVFFQSLSWYFIQKLLLITGLSTGGFSRTILEGSSEISLEVLPRISLGESLGTFLERFLPMLLSQCLSEFIIFIPYFLPKCFRCFFPSSFLRFLQKSREKLLGNHPRKLRWSWVMVLRRDFVRETLIAFRENFWKNPQKLLLQIPRKKLKILKGTQIEILGKPLGGFLRNTLGEIRGILLNFSGNNIWLTKTEHLSPTVHLQALTMTGMKNIRNAYGRWQ